MQCVMNRHTHTLHCSVHGVYKYIHVFVLDVSLKLHMPPVVYLVGVLYMWQSSSVRS